MIKLNIHDIYAKLLTILGFTRHRLVKKMDLLFSQNAMIKLNIHDIYAKLSTTSSTRCVNIEIVSNSSNSSNCDQTHFKANVSILSLCSPLFDTMFHNQNWKESTQIIDDIKSLDVDDDDDDVENVDVLIPSIQIGTGLHTSTKTVLNCLQALHSGEINISEEKEMWEMLSWADLYHIECLQSVVIEYYYKIIESIPANHELLYHFVEINKYNLYITQKLTVPESHLNRLSKIWHLARERVLQALMAMLIFEPTTSETRQNWEYVKKNVPRELLLTLIQDDDLHCRTEEDVFNFVNNYWSSDNIHTSKKKWKIAKEWFKAIRWGFLPSNTIISWESIQDGICEKHKAFFQAILLDTYRHKVNPTATAPFVKARTYQLPPKKTYLQPESFYANLKPGDRIMYNPKLRDDYLDWIFFEPCEFKASLFVGTPQMVFLVIDKREKTQYFNSVVQIPWHSRQYLAPRK